MRNLESLLLKLYTPHEVGTLIESIPETTLQSSSLEPDWYKHLQLYVTYPFSFCDAQGCGLAQLEEKIPEIKNLSVNAIHVLPPFESPLVDNGFDISDFLTIRGEIGGNDAFTSFLNTAQKNNLHVFLDLVLNHVSDQHEWFQKAIAGDPKYREYFVYSQDKPAFVSLIENEDGKYARYLINGTEKDIYIVFPDQAGEIPHWTQQKDGYWYYHTFYPQQIDLNWENPNVFMEFSKIILHWSHLGVSFRLDAIPYIGKRWDEGMRDSNTRTHLIIQALRALTDERQRGSAFLVETNRDYDQLKPYFGNQQTREADLAYNFQLTEAIWTALILDDSNFIWETLDRMKHYPDWAQWVTFLRNHDELTLRYCPKETHDRLCAMLRKSGLAFRSGHSISGRTASFLQENSPRIIMSHLLLASLPGNPAIMYGDEIGKTNDLDYMQQQYELKQKQGVDSNLKVDSRDSNRGTITDMDWNSPPAVSLRSEIANIFNVRSTLVELPISLPTQIETPAHIFGAQYVWDDTRFSIYINLSNKETSHVIDSKTKNEVVLTVNGASSTDSEIILPPFAGVWIISHDE